MDWLEPWEPVDEHGGVAGVLARELPPGHVLEGQAVRTLARRGDTDDVLFALEDGRVAEVHLTWSSGPGDDPRMPWTVLYPSLEVWARDAMEPQHREWAD